MDKAKIVETLKTTTDKVVHKIKKVSPEICVAVAIVTGVAGAVTAAMATTKVSTILDESKETVETIHTVYESGEHADEYTEEDMKKDLAITYAKTGINLVKNYALPISLEVLSVCCVISSYKILKARTAAMAAAFATLDTGFKAYRKGVVERFGEEVDKDLRHSIKATTVEETTVDPETGKKHKEKHVEKTCEYDGCSDFMRIFDETSTVWTKDPVYNRSVLRALQSRFNNLLETRGYVFLNEVYESLGFPRVKAGQVVGWVYRPDDPDWTGDNYIDFGVYDVDCQRNRDFINGFERTCILDFNVDGVIYDYI